MSSPSDDAAVDNPFSKECIGLLSICWSFFAIYLVLFVVAVRCTYQTGTPAAKRLRNVAIALFLTIVCYMVFSSIDASTLVHSKYMPERTYGSGPWGPLVVDFFIRTSTVAAAAICDGLIVWRLHCFYSYKIWSLYIPAAAVMLTTAIGLTHVIIREAAVACAIVYNWSYTRYSAVNHVGVWMFTVWGWLLVATSMAMTVCIVGRILCIACKADPACSTRRLGRQSYRAIPKAFIESAFLAWLDIFVWAATGLRSVTGGSVSSSSNIVADVTYYILPVILGISQCLIIVRLHAPKKVPRTKRTRKQSVLRARIDSSGRVLAMLATSQPEEAAVVLDIRKASAEEGGKGTVEVKRTDV